MLCRVSRHTFQTGNYVDKEVWDTHTTVAIYCVVQDVRITHVKIGYYVVQDVCHTRVKLVAMSNAQNISEWLL